MQDKMTADNSQGSQEIQEMQDMQDMQGSQKTGGQQKESAPDSVTMPAKDGRDKEAGVFLRNVTLAAVPDEVWKSLTRKSFFRRHPVISVLLVLVVLGSVFALGRGAATSDGEIVAEEPSLALITVKGAILDVTEKLAWVDKIAAEDNILGVVLRVDSPGGGAAASQELYAALKRLASVKPMVVSMGSTAASGGLMLSMAGERIFANASTVTGSIGVRMDLPQLKKLMDTLGIGSETLTTAPYKDAGSPMRPLSERDREYLGSVLQDMHDQFVDIVAEGRKMERAQAAALADGRIFTGREALAKGLVDELGGLREATDWLAAKTGVNPQKELVTEPEKDSWLPLKMTSLVRSLLTDAVSSLQEEHARPGFLFMW